MSKYSIVAQAVYMCDGLDFIKQRATKDLK